MSTFCPVPLLFDYPGSKAYLTARLVHLIPDHDHYVSVFGGSAADILGKPRSRQETYNDRDEDLPRLFRLVQSPIAVTELCHRIEATPYSRAEYVDALHRLRGEEFEDVRAHRNATARRGGRDEVRRPRSARARRSRLALSLFWSVTDER